MLTKMENYNKIACIGEERKRAMKHIFESRLLLVDDNADLRKMVTEILHREGFLYVECASCVREAEEYFFEKNMPAERGAEKERGKKEPDLVILDINLPDGDGFSLMQKIRIVSGVPVLFLSARDEDKDRLLGLGLGADDYVVKPFLPKELTLRISAILRRTYFSGKQEMEEEKEILTLRNCQVDFKSGTVLWCDQNGEEKETRNGKRELSLTAKELLILRKLRENRGNIVTFDQLCQAVWEDHYFGYENTIMVHIRRLREKIEENPSSPKFLLTVRGLGYKLRTEQRMPE